MPLFSFFLFFRSCGLDRVGSSETETFEPRDLWETRPRRDRDPSNQRSRDRSRHWIKYCFKHFSSLLCHSHLLDDLMQINCALQICSNSDTIPFFTHNFRIQLNSSCYLFKWLLGSAHFTHPFRSFLDLLNLKYIAWVTAYHHEDLRHCEECNTTCK